MKYLKSMNEHADELAYKSISDKITLKYNMGGYPFRYRTDGKFEIGPENRTHSIFGQNRLNYIQKGDIEGIDVSTFDGRFWPKFKIISFWQYPSKEQLKDIIKKIEEEKNIKIWNNNWRIEVLGVDDENEIKFNNLNKEKLFLNKIKGEEKELSDIKGFRNHYGIYKLIPIEKYEFSKNPSREDYEWHLKNVRDKQKLKNVKFKDFWNERAKKQKPLKFKQALLTSETFQKNI